VNRNSEQKIEKIPISSEWTTMERVELTRHLERAKDILRCGEESLSIRKSEDAAEILRRRNECLRINGLIGRLRSQGAESLEFKREEFDPYIE
jgi:hypothetical protein